MICKKCGAKIADGAQVCASCGAAQDNTAQYVDAEFFDARKTGKHTGPKPDFTVPDANSPAYDDNTVFYAAGQVASPSDGSASIPDFLVPDSSDTFATATITDDGSFANNNRKPDFTVPVDDSALTYSAKEHSAQAHVAPVRNDPHVGNASKAVGARDSSMPKAHRKAVVICVILALALVGSGAFAYTRFAGEHHPESDATPKHDSTTQVSTAKADTKLKQAAEPSPKAEPHTITLAIEADGLTEEGSRIPVQLKGYVQGGAEVDEKTYLSHEGSGLELLPGTYEVSILASPISAEGILYNVPTDVLSIRLLDDGSFESIPAEPLIFTAVDADEVTDEMIQTALSWVRDDPERQDRADKLGEAARSRRDHALATAEPSRTEEVAAQQETQSAEQQDYSQTTDTTDYADESANSAWSQYYYDEYDSGQFDTSEYSSDADAASSADSSDSSDDSGSAGDSSSGDSGSAGDSSSGDSGSAGDSSSGDSGGTGDSGSSESQTSGVTDE